MGACSIEAIVFTLIKNIMDKKYYSPLKVCYLIGLINFIVMTFIALFILLIFNNDLDFIFGLSILKKFGLFRFIIYFIFFSLLIGICKLLINIILNKYSTLHLFIFFKLDSFLDSLEFIIDKESKEKERYEFLIESIMQFIEIFMYLVYLEIIELNFCGLSENIKNNIQNRAIDEYKEIGKEEKERDNLNANFESDEDYPSKL